MHYGDHDAFAIAVFHQLHCLHYLLTEFNKLLENTGRAKSRQTHRHGLGSEALQHVGHCFDYLRSSLMCCGDTAFEGQASDINAPGTLGEASHHVCKDYERVKSWAESHRVSDQRGFGNE
jgi:hypothetical protein